MGRTSQSAKPIVQQLVDASRANTDRYHLDAKLFDPVYANARQLLSDRRRDRVESPMPCHADFVSAFVDGRSFLGDEGEVLTVAVREVGRLVVTSGRIVVCDPNYGSGHEPLARSVPVGTYPVLLSSANDRIACAMLRIRDIEPVLWEMAVWPGQNPADLEGDQFYGYGVDAGTGAFLDADQNQYLDKLADEALFDGTRIPGDPFSGEWAERVLAEKTGGNLIAFSSGYGDGRYPSYWGLDERGDAVCLVTDFGLLVDHPGVSFSLTGAFCRPPGEVRHRALELADLVMEIIPGQSADRSIIVGFLGPKADSANASFEDDSGEQIDSGYTDINVSGSHGELSYSYREHVLSPKVTEQDRAEIRLRVYVALPACPMPVARPTGSSPPT
ncbi:Putative uncharacterized protein OS=Streptomyces pristinaespiralis ATCC 25486 GN=SSDG_04266 PE=4 SV=2: DUF4241 [Gemmata massiliana]|uniref:DUF4241 domain-containing protein n=1 Tax=Gemmata massiliana TaxID=1210884 RepID=A0A6P2D7C6_9BACT|nr:DUF4241 domain-containing protein [Gemmata massiliana]VTR96275.1 Putative uncharacterized protein OS=Streptomyces pristinaespiralis ATCC 25486 GN=SSDG_04266 PE=4 SV=2: DUF4241 [Gemmata massiliana]